MDRYSVVADKETMSYFIWDNMNGEEVDKKITDALKARMICDKLNERPCGTPTFIPTPMPKVLPALGVKPRWLHEEQRMDEIKAALKRCMDKYQEIRQEWLDEYNDLAKRKAAADGRC